MKREKETLKQDLKRGRQVLRRRMLTEESVSLTTQRREFRDYAQAGEADKEFYRTVCGRF